MSIEGGKVCFSMQDKNKGRKNALISALPTYAYAQKSVKRVSFGADKWEKIANSELFLLQTVANEFLPIWKSSFPPDAYSQKHWKGFG